MIHGRSVRAESQTEVSSQLRFDEAIFEMQKFIQIKTQPSVKPKILRPGHMN